MSNFMGGPGCTKEEVEAQAQAPAPMARDDKRQGAFQLFYTPGLRGKPIIRVVADDMVQTFLVPNDAPRPKVLAQYALKPEDQGKPIKELEALYPWPPRKPDAAAPATPAPQPKAGSGSAAEKVDAH